MTWRSKIDIFPAPTVTMWWKRSWGLAAVIYEGFWVLFEVLEEHLIFISARVTTVGMSRTCIV